MILKPCEDGWKIIWECENDITPLFDGVIVERDEQKEVSRGGILIPEDTRENASTGTVIAVGEGCTDLRAGDYVVFPDTDGIDVKFTDSDITKNYPEYMLLRYKSIIGKRG